MSTSNKVIVLQSSDGDNFEVEKSVAVEPQTIKHMIVSKVINYCKKHVDPTNSGDLKTFDSEFVKVDQDTLFDLILAANYLNIKSLLDLTCQTVADMIKGKSTEEIRERLLT